MTDVNGKYYKDKMTQILRGIIHGSYPCEVVHDVETCPVFRVFDAFEPVTFCVFDDSGSYDYLAWFARGQDVLTFEDTHGFTGLTVEEEEVLADLLWSRRDPKKIWGYESSEVA